MKMLQSITEFREFVYSYYFLQKTHDFGVSPINADHTDLKLSPTAPKRRLRRDYVCMNSVFGSPEDGATSGFGWVREKGNHTG